MNPSIRQRLLLILLPATLLIWLTNAYFVYVDTRSEIKELADAQLAETARALLNLLSHEYYEERNFRDKQGGKDTVLADTQRLPPHLAAALENYAQKMIYQMWLDNGELVLRSAGAPEVRLSPVDVGFSDETIGGNEWRIFSLVDPETRMIVQVGERLSQLEQLQDFIARRILFPVVIATPLLAWLIWYGVGRAMRPLQAIARRVAGLGPSHLEPLETQGVALEAKPLVDALNTLLRRLEEAFENERRFTADAAHELRTPLAALRTQVQVALREGDDARRRAALRQVIQGVDRATHLVHQLLVLARIDPERWDPDEGCFDLCDLIAERIAARAGEAHDKGIEIGLACDGPATVCGARDMFDILVSNLINNAIKYTPDGGTIEVRVARRDDEILLEVADSGPGIPAEDRERVFERFYRRERGRVPGSGLGLSIVKRIADIQSARIELGESELGGLLVTVRLPAGRKRRAAGTTAGA